MQNYAINNSEHVLSSKQNEMLKRRFESSSKNLVSAAQTLGPGIYRIAAAGGQGGADIGGRGGIGGNGALIVGDFTVTSTTSMTTVIGYAGGTLNAQASTYCTDVGYGAGGGGGTAVFLNGILAIVAGGGNFHVLSHLLLIYICKLHWNCQVAVEDTIHMTQASDVNRPTEMEAVDLYFLQEMTHTRHYALASVERMHMTIVSHTVL